MKKNVNKDGLFGPRDTISRLKNKGYYPLFFVALAIIGIVIVALFIYYIAVPLVAKDFNKDDGPTIIRDNSGIGAAIVQKENLYTSVVEHLFRSRYINHPQKADEEIIWTGGSDGAGNPSLIAMYIYAFNKDEDKYENSILDIKSENNNIFYPQLGKDYIAYVDSKDAGGGSIFYYNRKTGKKKLVKDYYGATPKIYLEQNRIIWFEQVAGNLASVYVYDILLDKLAAVETQLDLPFVYGGIGVNGNRVIFPDLLDTDLNGGDLHFSKKSQLKILDLSTGAIEQYNPDMYATSPKIYGNVIGWLDSNNSPTAGLYIRKSNGEQKKLAESVTNFTIYDGVVTYCQNERIYCYFVENDLTLPLTKEDKRAIMIDGANGYVFWYDVTQVYERDIVKYAKVGSTSWQG